LYVTPSLPHTVTDRDQTFWSQCKFSQTQRAILLKTLHTPSYSQGGRSLHVLGSARTKQQKKVTLTHTRNKYKNQKMYLYNIWF